jgi:RimJ/RimL family protein N-acetyltransferase
MLTGPRLTLRPWTLADAPALAPACGDPDIVRFTTVPEAYSPAAAEAWIARQHERTQEGQAVVLAIVAQGEAQPVGMAGVFGLGAGERAGRLGYWVIRERRGEGLVTAAMELLVPWAFAALELDELRFDVEPANAASRAVALRAGARLHGRAPDRELALDRYILRGGSQTP